MSIRLSFAILAIVVLSPLRAQDEPVHMTPEFPLIFPLAQNGKDVTVKYPVYIDPTTIIKPGMVLRTLYVLTYDNSPESSDLALAHRGNMEQAYSRGTLTSEEKSKMPPALAHELEGYRRTVWQVANNFVLAMAQYPTDTMHLIYSPTGKDQDLEDGRFSFFDGLMIGSPGGKVTVLAVEKESKAEAAGIKAGDEVVSIGGIPLHDSLDAFAAAYTSAKKAAKENEVSSYPMVIRSGDKGDEQTKHIAMPPSLKGGLMNGFN